MKRNFLLVLILIAGCFKIWSQPPQAQFTNNNCFQLNDTSRLGFALVTQSFDTLVPKTGYNFTWDFSSTGFPGPWGTWTSPTTPYLFQASNLSTHVPFQSTQINEYANVGMGRDDFYSYSSLADTLYYHGYYSGGNNYVYYLPLPYLVFPMNFSDSIRVRKPIMNATLSVQTGTVTRYWIYDGFGTIKFPYGTENNVYRIRTKQIDSLMVNGFFISATVNEELIWIKQSDGIPVLRLQKQGVSNMYAYYASAQGTSSISEISENNSLRVYPNPGTDFIYLSNKGSLKEKKYTISDYLGRVVLNGILKSEEVEIDIRTIPNGFYLFQVEGSVNQKVKIIKN